MKREPRGFDYPLEPLRRKCDWELHELRHALKRLNEDVAGRTERSLTCATQLSTASDELARQMEQSQRIHVDQQFIAHAYIGRLVQQLSLARAAQKQCEAERDETIQQLFKAQKFADGLEEHRDSAVSEYANVLGKADMVEMDEAWLRSTHGRNAQ